MKRTFKSIFLTILLIPILSLILPGCYTQLSRPRVDTEDEYYMSSEADTVQEYYQDEGNQGEGDSKDVYIYNYYPPYGIDYYDYWYWSYYPYPWRYVGPDPYYWWEPYGHWWTPGWYVGVYYHDYWSRGGYYRYDDYHHWGGYRDHREFTSRNYERRPFDRRSFRGIGQDERTSDSQPSLVKPQSPTRAERPRQTLSKPETQDRINAPVRKNRAAKDTENQRSKTIAPKVVDDGKSSTTTKQRSTSRQTRTIKKPQRSSERGARPKTIERPRSRSTPDTPKKNDTTPNRKSKQNSNSISRPSSSGNSHANRPSTPSYTPRSSSSSGTRSTAPRSSSSPTRSSSSRSSKSSGSSKTNKR